MAVQGAQGPGWHTASQGWGQCARRLPHRLPQVWGVRKGSHSGLRALPQKHLSLGTDRVCVWQPGQRQGVVALACRAAGVGAGALLLLLRPPPRREAPPPRMVLMPLLLLLLPPPTSSSGMIPRLLPRQVRTHSRCSTQKHVAQAHTASSLRTLPMHTMHS